tara:strand:+ start:1148 stop:1402 length:255 start_codon:yes stop_codon:yes gene_type:complete
MKKLFFLLLMGCLTHQEPATDLDTQYWICHNLESEEHGNICSEACYEAGDDHKFCWFLEEERCFQQSLPQEVQNACKVFEKLND